MGENYAKVNIYILNKNKQVRHQQLYKIISFMRVKLNQFFDCFVNTIKVKIQRNVSNN